jgi:hypothetical protein
MACGALAQTATGSGDDDDLAFYIVVHVWYLRIFSD